jgi:hypothetical protein
MIYLASPYSHPDKAVEAERYQQTMRAFAELCLAGAIIYSPIVSCHPAAVAYGMPTDAAWWARFNREFMFCCDRLVVLRLPGWEESVGVRDEITFFAERGIKPEWMS